MGETFAAETSQWTPDQVAFEYQWLSNDEPIDGATEEFFAFPDTVMGSLASVSVTGTLPTQESETGTSGQVGPVSRQVGAPATPVALDERDPRTRPPNLRLTKIRQMNPAPDTARTLVSTGTDTAITILV